VKIAILGFGVEGQAAYEYWSNSENQVTICDQNENLQVPEGARTKLGLQYLSGLDLFDVIVRSPGLHPDDIVSANSPEILNKVTSSTNEFFRVSPSKNIIGVTGTKGKGTTCTLIAKILEASGLKVHLGGNIGYPVLSLLKNDIKNEDWVVVELSSFQLTDLKYSPHIAVCLMIVPEHLNWHSNLEDYISAKTNIFSHQTAQDTAIYYSNNEYSKKMADSSPGIKIPYYTEPGAYVSENNFMISGQVICSTSDVKLIGQHNWQNICAALTAYWQVDQNVEAASKAITEFAGLEHRLEIVKTIKDTVYYNDSFASVPDATIAAIEAIKENKVMIIGGFDRNLDLTNLANAIKQHDSDIKEVVLIGNSANRTAQALDKVGFSNYQVSTAQTMAEIVRLASGFADKNDAVVLSPGFPSFDMFNNFEDRGSQFKEEVNKL
jgi:UDP-N-acetylmuramoylalanine--D-glutamate ligase